MYGIGGCYNTTHEVRHHKLRKIKKTNEESNPYKLTQS